MFFHFACNGDYDGSLMSLSLMDVLRASLDRKLERTRKDSGPVRLVPRISTMATASTCGDIQTQSDPRNSAGPESPIHTASNPCPLQQRNMPYSAAPAHNINISISNIRALHTLSIKRSHSSPSSVRLNNHEAVV